MHGQKNINLWSESCRVYLKLLIKTILPEVAFPWFFMYYTLTMHGNSNIKFPTDLSSNTIITATQYTCGDFRQTIKAGHRTQDTGHNS